VVGDWNVDGSIDVGLFHPATGRWELGLPLNGATTSPFYYPAWGGVVNQIADVPIVGRW
jgi:hypothetical protein